MSKSLKEDLYYEKINWLQENYPELSPCDFYRTMFPKNAFQEQGESNGDFKSNGIIMFRRKGEKEGTMHTSIIFDEHSEIDDCVNCDGFFKDCEFAIISGCSYVGKRKLNSNARKCYAIIIDIDEVDRLRLSMLLSMSEEGIVPKPTAVVVSGNGVHLYYILHSPIDTTAKNYEALSDLKQLLSRILWNSNTSLDPNPQYQGITQGYRVVGTKTKRTHIAKAFQTGSKIYVEELIEAVYNLEKMPYSKPKKKSSAGSKNPPIFASRTEEYRKNPLMLDKLYDTLAESYDKRITLEEAKVKYPEWYKRRIVDKEPPKSIAFGKGLYNWWLSLISLPENVHIGHRWNCMYCLAAFAQKCEIPESQFRSDLAALFPIYQSLSTKKETEFTVNDVKSVIKAFQNTDLTKMTAKRISALSGIKFGKKKHIKPKKKQKDHLRECREIRDAKYEDGKHWYDNGGRPSKENIVREYIKNHPDSNVSQIAKDCGVSRPTVYKYL